MNIFSAIMIRSWAGKQGRYLIRMEDNGCQQHKLSALMSAAMGAAGLGLAFTYYSSRHYFRNAEFLSLGAESAFIDLGIALPPGRYHSKAALAFKDTLKEVLQAADG